MHNLCWFWAWKWFEGQDLLILVTQFEIMWYSAPWEFCLLISSAGVSMGHPPGDQLGDARIWSSWYLHHWKRVQVAAECLSWGENCCRLLTTHCFSRWVGGQKLVIAFHMFCCSDRLGNIDDLQRIYYYKHYLNQESFLPEIIFSSLSITL